MIMNMKMFIVVVSFSFFAAFAAGCSLVLDPNQLVCEACKADGGPVDGGNTDSGPSDGGGDAGSNPCIPDPCSAHGSCSDNGGQPDRVCDLGWSGITCGT